MDNFIVIIVYIFSLVNAKSLVIDDHITNPKWPIIVYIPPAYRTHSFIEDVFEKNGVYREEITNIVADSKENIKDIIYRHNNRRQNYRLPETISSLENEEFRRKQMDTYKKIKSRIEQNKKNKKHSSSFDHFKQQLRLALKTLRSGIDVSSSDERDINNIYSSVPMAVKTLRREIRIDPEKIAIDKVYTPCLEPELCRTHNGFADFLKNLLLTMLKLDDPYYSFDDVSKTLANVMKLTGFSDVLDVPSDICIKTYSENFENSHEDARRELVRMAVSVIDRREDPIIFPVNFDQQKYVGMENVMAIMDEEFPKSEENTNVWNQVTNNLNKYLNFMLNDLEDTMYLLVVNVKNNLNKINAKMKATLLENMKTACHDLYVYGGSYHLPNHRPP